MWEKHSTKGVGGQWSQGPKVQSLANKADKVVHLTKLARNKCRTGLARQAGKRRAGGARSQGHYINQDMHLYAPPQSPVAAAEGGVTDAAQYLTRLGARDAAFGSCYRACRGLWGVLETARRPRGASRVNPVLHWLQRAMA